MQALKHEIKKIGSLALFFLMGFGYILIIMNFQLFLKEYSIDTYVLSKALIGALVAAQAVAIMDVTSWMNRFEQSPRYLSILYKTFVSTLAVLILGIVEHFLHAYHQIKAIAPAFKSLIESENFYQVLAVTLCISIVFLMHNIFKFLTIMSNGLFVGLAIFISILRLSGDCQNQPIVLSKDPVFEGWHLSADLL